MPEACLGIPRRATQYAHQLFSLYSRLVGNMPFSDHTSRPKRGGGAYEKTVMAAAKLGPCLVSWSGWACGAILGHLSTDRCACPPAVSPWPPVLSHWTPMLQTCASITNFVGALPP